MQPRCYFALTLLYSLSILSPVLSVSCNETQYGWPSSEPKYCCNMCLPGHYLVRRSDHCIKKCAPCKGERYRDNHTVEMTCNFCQNCNRPNMEYKSRCNATHNAVCRCKAGYECNDQLCKQCVLIPRTTKLPPSATGSPRAADTALTRQGPDSTRPPYESCVIWHQNVSSRSCKLLDATWLVVMIVFLTAGIVVVVTKIKPFLRWIRSKHGYLFTVPPSEDTDVSKPVQDTCGKCEQPLV